MFQSSAFPYQRAQWVNTCLFIYVGWLVVFNVPSTARSFRDGTPMDVKLNKYTVPTGNRTLGRRMAVNYVTAESRRLHSLHLLRVTIKINSFLFRCKTQVHHNCLWFTPNTDYIIIQCQGCKSNKISKFPNFSLTYLHFSLTNQTYKS